MSTENPKDDQKDATKAEEHAPEKEGIWSNIKSLGSHLFHAAMDLQEIQTDVVTAVPLAIYNENEKEIKAAAGGVVDLVKADIEFETSALRRAAYNMEHKPVTTIAENIMLPGFSIVHAYVAEGFDRLTK